MYVPVAVQHGPRVIMYVPVASSCYNVHTGRGPCVIM